MLSTKNRSNVSLIFNLLFKYGYELSTIQVSSASVAHLAQVQHIGAHYEQGIDCLEYCHSLDALKSIV